MNNTSSIQLQLSKEEVEQLKAAILDIQMLCINAEPTRQQSESVYLLGATFRFLFDLPPKTCTPDHNKVV